MDSSYWFKKNVFSLLSKYREQNISIKYFYEQKKENLELRKVKEKFDIELIQLFTSKKALADELTRMKAQHDALKQECSRLLAAKKSNK